MSADNEEEDSDKRKKVDVKPSQVVGGALASVTAAFLGSQLGVAGTIVGAGLTSVVITVGGASAQLSGQRVAIGCGDLDSLHVAEGGDDL